MQTVSWYQNCLKNSSLSAVREREHIVSECRRLLHLIADNKFKQIQIDFAIRNKKESFDYEKYMKNARLEYMKEAEQRITAALQNVAALDC